jgi:hypothetical protein
MFIWDYTVFAMGLKIYNLISAPWWGRGGERKG